jgi:hypothetical protein
MKGVLLFIIILQVVKAVTPNLNPIKCINYYGFETERQKPVCDWVHQPDFYLRTLKEYMDINTIRLPFSYEYVRNGDFSGMDAFIQSTNSYNIQVILDYHRTWASHQGPEPLERVDIQQISHVWSVIARRYADNPYVIGMGIFNEYQGRNKTYLNLYHQTIVSYVEKHHPGRYYYFLGCSTWGHDCNDINFSFDKISPDRVFVDFHTYHFIYDQWQLDNLTLVIDDQLPYSIPSTNILVGEIGWRQDIELEKNWAIAALDHFKSRSISNVCGWTIAHSGDTGGWFNDDCLTFRYDKADILRSFWDNPKAPKPQPVCDCSCSSTPSWNLPWWTPPKWPGPGRNLKPELINSTLTTSLRGHK